jgi:hypothetical protein
VSASSHACEEAVTFAANFFNRDWEQHSIGTVY